MGTGVVFLAFFGMIGGVIYASVTGVKPVGYSREGVTLGNVSEAFARAVKEQHRNVRDADAGPRWGDVAGGDRRRGADARGRGGADGVEELEEVDPEEDDRR